MKRAVILFAEGYETVEALLVVDLLRRGGAFATDKNHLTKSGTEKA